MIPKCQHQVTVNCTTEPTQYDCEEYCVKILDCGHECLRKCKECADGCKKCNEVVSIELACADKSTIEVFCHEAIKFEPSLRPFAFRNLCAAPCSSELECMQACKSTCGQCFGGTIHVKRDRQTCLHVVNASTLTVKTWTMCVRSCVRTSVFTRIAQSFAGRFVSPATRIATSNANISFATICVE